MYVVFLNNQALIKNSTHACITVMKVINRKRFLCLGFLNERHEILSDLCVTITMQEMLTLSRLCINPKDEALLHQN